ncbi:MAG: NERD domain-containing protein [Candidatus Coatesbacteria bacterium]|nr:NERD domain-containing protein [Candidatus Coatesbacteria bacterium]
MAKMFPGSVGYYKKSIPESELTVLETMEKSLPDDYMVFYSIAYINRKDSNNIPAHGEVDIIVLNKEKGMLFLEIKGGRRIFIEKGAFYSENHKGEINKIKDPFNQAKINMYSIKDIILKKNNFKWIDELPFCYGYGVIFPNGIFKSSAISFDEKMIIDHKGINSIKQKIDNIYDFWSGSKQMKSPLNKKEVDFLVRDVLFPEKDIIERISLEEMFAYDETKFINATIEQANVIKINTDFNKRLLIRGAAGTGKTVIALEIAKRNASMGKKVLLLCYNRLLGYYLFEETGKQRI